jgi:transposase
VTKGFDADSLRERVRGLGGGTCIPRRKNCSGRRPFRRRLYHRRHHIANFFCTIKRHRRLSTRYEKLAVSFLAFVQLAAILDWLNY